MGLFVLREDNQPNNPPPNLLMANTNKRIMAKNL